MTTREPLDALHHVAKSIRDLADPSGNAVEIMAE